MAPVEAARVEDASTDEARPIAPVVTALSNPDRVTAQDNWKRALARRVLEARPDLGNRLVQHLGVIPSADDSLKGFSIGGLAAIYEALLAISDSAARRASGQYFTPDDVAEFMARQSNRFPVGTWLDPCCGIGNLSWHLCAQQTDPARFLREGLSLADLDPVALVSAEVLLAARFAGQGDVEAVDLLSSRSRAGDFLTPTDSPPSHFVLMNPPYGKAPSPPGFVTASTGETYAFFLEKALKQASGFIAVTPSSFLSGDRYRSLRKLLRGRGGEVYVFDNVPDTVFSGYKYGSQNTSRTNFVRTSVLISPPDTDRWRITPIIRWSAATRDLMWSKAESYLRPLQDDQGSGWPKLMPGTEDLWRTLQSQPTLASLLSSGLTPYPLWVAATPRYYITASKRPLKRSSVHVLHFDSEGARDEAYLLLNSHLAYWWWRTLDGGITLKKNTLTSLPLPTGLTRAARGRGDLIAQLHRSDEEDLRVKLNAGKRVENVKRPLRLIEEIDRLILAPLTIDFSMVTAPDMFTPRDA